MGITVPEQAEQQPWRHGTAPPEFACVPPFPPSAAQGMLIVLRDSLSCSELLPSVASGGAAPSSRCPLRPLGGGPGLAGERSALNTNKEHISKESATTAPVGFYKLLPGPALLVLTAARGQQEAATYQTHIARFSFLLQVRFCKFMRAKLCRHTTCVCPFAFSSFLPNNQECFCSCPFPSYPFPFSLSLALYGTITFVVLKDFIVPSTLFYNVSTVFLKKN